jgi:hypothetical protein
VSKTDKIGVLIMIYIIGPKDPKRTDAINTTSRSPIWSKGLSPFFLGPVKLYGNYVAKNVENGWQFVKTYLQFTDIFEDPTPDYFKWAETGWNDTRAHRYPMGKGARPLYSYWDGNKLSYIEARKQIYIPLYSEAVQKSEAWKLLVEHYKNNKDIWLWDFDGYDHISLGMTMDEVINCPTRKMGHAFVLKMLLEKIK